MRECNKTSSTIWELNLQKRVQRFHLLGGKIVIAVEKIFCSPVNEARQRLRDGKVIDLLRWRIPGSGGAGGLFLTSEIEAEEGSGVFTSWIINPSWETAKAVRHRV